MSTANSNISRYLPIDEFNAAIGAASPSAGNVFATIADLSGGDTLYTANDTIGAARIATITDSITFSKGGIASGTTAVFNIVSDTDGDLLFIENQNRDAFKNVLTLNDPVSGDTDLLLNSRNGTTTFRLVTNDANGFAFYSDDGISGAGVEGLGTVSDFSFNVSAIRPFSVGGTTIGTTTRPFNDMYLTSGGYDFIQTANGASNIEFQLGNTRNDGVNNKSAFILTSTVDYTSSHYLSAGIVATTYFTVAGKGAIGINLGGSAALAVSPDAMIHAKGTGATSATSQLLLQNSTSTTSIEIFNDNRIAVGPVIVQNGQFQIKGADSLNTTYALYVESSGNLPALKVSNARNVGVGSGHTSGTSIDSALHAKYLSGEGIISEASAGSIDATIRAHQSSSDQKAAIIESKNSDADIYQLISYGRNHPINPDLGGIRWGQGNLSFFFGNTEIGVVQSNGVFDASTCTIAEINAAAVTALTTREYIEGRTLFTKSGRVVNATFTGNPKTATVTFGTAFADADYSISVICETINDTSYVPIVESVAAGSFIINMGVNNINDLTEVHWTATKHGETS